MRTKRKTSPAAGFTLAETLLAVLILSMVAVILTNGVPLAKSAYERVVVGANARMLLYNTVTVLRNELGTATNVVVDTTNKSITYYSTDIHAASKIFLADGSDEKNPEGTIMLQQYVSTDDVTLTELGIGAPRRLVSNSASNGNLYITLGFPEENLVSNGTINFVALYVYNVTDTDKVSPLVSLDKLSVRPVVGPIVVKASDVISETEMPGSEDTDLDIEGS